MSKIKFVALDIDGTLFNNNSEIGEKDQQTIKAATDAGVHVVISTGRPYIGVPVDLLSSLGVKYAITSNGAGVYRIPEKECIYSSCMEPALVCPIIRELQKKDIHFDAFIGGNRYGQKSMQPIIDRLGMPLSVREYVKTTSIVTDDLADFIEERQLEVQKITLNFYPLPDGSFKDREETFSLLSSYPQITLLSGGYHNLEFTKAGTTKAMGLRFLANLLGITMEETMACGDSQNDLDILNAAEMSVAMGNAKEEVKKIADFVTLTNEECGVGYAIRKFVLDDN